MPNVVPQLIKPDYFKYPRGKLLWYALYCVLLPLSLFTAFSSETFLKAPFLGLHLKGSTLRLGCHLTSSIGSLCCQPGSCCGVCQMVMRMMRCLDSLEILMVICLSLVFHWEGVVNIWLLKQKTLFKTFPWSRRTALWSHLQEQSDVFPLKICSTKTAPLRNPVNQLPITMVTGCQIQY